MRSTLLSYAFLLWAKYVYNSMFLRNYAQISTKGYFLVFVLFALACFTKSSAIVLTPFLFFFRLVLWDKIQYPSF